MVAPAGIVAIVYDKRTAGYSLTNRSFPALADDAVAAADVLRSWPGVDPDRVRLLGRSEGGWVALGPVLAGRPVPWLVLQLLAAGVVAAAAVTAARWWRGRHQGRGGAAPTVLAGTALFLPWALYWGLLIP